MMKVRSELFVYYRMKAEIKVAGYLKKEKRKKEKEMCTPVPGYILVLFLVPVQGLFSAFNDL